MLLVKGYHRLFVDKFDAKTWRRTTEATKFPKRSTSKTLLNAPVSVYRCKLQKCSQQAKDTAIVGISILGKGQRMMNEQENQSSRRQPQQRQCNGCGKLAVLILIYDQYNTDVEQRLCKACEEARACRLEAFYEGN